jgi:hypothetical protein
MHVHQDARVHQDLRFLHREVVSHCMTCWEWGGGTSRCLAPLTNPKSVNMWEDRMRVLYSRLDLCESLRESVTILELAGSLEGEDWKRPTPQEDLTL